MWRVRGSLDAKALNKSVSGQVNECKLSVVLDLLESLLKLWYSFSLNNGFCVWLDYNCDARLLDKMHQSHTCSQPAPGVRLNIYSGAGRGSDIRMKWSENPNTVSVNDPVTGLATWYQVCWITQNIEHLLLVFRSFVCLWVCDGHLHFHWYEQ